MYIIIIGSGRLGRSTAKELIKEGHNVVIIDNDGYKLDLLGTGFNGIRIKGVEFDNTILLSAGINKADAFLALTSDDNKNIMASEIAREIFEVKKVISRVCNPSMEYVYKSLNLDTINITTYGVNIIKKDLLHN